MSKLQSLLAAALKRNLAGGKAMVPEAGVLLWNLFMQISASRTYHAAGPNPISYGEIEAFARLHSWPLQPRHVDTIRALDDAWLEHAYREQSKATGGKDGKSFDSQRYANAQPLTVAAFDAVF